MKRRCLSLAFPAMLLTGFGLQSAMAQHAAGIQADRQAQENEPPVRHGIASDGTLLHEGTDLAAMPAQRTSMEAEHRARSLHDEAAHNPPETNPEGFARRNRILCEHRRALPMTEWRCKPHAQ